MGFDRPGARLLWCRATRLRLFPFVKNQFEDLGCCTCAAEPDAEYRCRLGQKCCGKILGYL